MKKVIPLLMVVFCLCMICPDMYMAFTEEDCNDLAYDSGFASYKDMLLANVGIDSYDIPAELVEGKYYSVWTNGEQHYLYVTNKEQYFFTQKIIFDDFYRIALSHSEGKRTEVTHSIYELNSSGEWQKITNGFNAMIIYQKYSNDNVFDGCYYNGSFRLVYANHDMYTLSGVMIYTPNTEKYDKEVGYLTDLSIKTLYLESADDDSSITTNGVKKVYTFGELNSNGENITDGKWQVRFYGQIYVHKGVDVGVCDNIRYYDMVMLGSYPAADLRIELNLYEMKEMLYTKSSFNGLGWWESNFYHVSEYLYFQLVRQNEDGTLSYGNLIRYNPCRNEGVFDSITPDGYEEEYAGSLGSSSGSGSSFEEAEKNADNDVPPFGTDFTAALTSFTEMLGAFPQVIGAVFSFMPAWLQNFVVVAFALLVFLILCKFLRG